MKHIVTLTISNPSHEHISLRRRQSTTNYMVEARDEAEAIFRASNHFKKLGNYVHNAVIAESTLNEEVEQIDEEDIKKSKVMHKGKEIGEVGIDTEASPGNGKWYAKHHASGMDTLGHDSRKDAVAEVRWVHAANRETNEEVELDEAVKVGPANHDKSTDTVWHGVHHDGKEIGTIGTHSAQHVEKHGKWGFEDSRGYGRRHGQPAMNSKEEALDALVNRHKEYTKKETNEEVEQLDEIGDTPKGKTALTSYIKKAAGQSFGLRGLGVGFDNDKNMYAKKALRARTPKTKEQARTDMETSGRLAKTFTRKAYNRTTGISRAAVRLAKEEVEQIDEESAHSIVNNLKADGKHQEAGAKAFEHGLGRKYGQHFGLRSTKNADEMDFHRGYDKAEMRSKKKVDEEVEQIDEVGPQKRMTRLFNKIRDARAGDKFKRSGMPVPPPEAQHTNVAAHNKALGRALRKEEVVNEKAPPGAKYERMVNHIKDKYSEDGTLTPQEKAIAYAAAWKAKNSGK